jgi:N-acetylglucosamine repressor
MRSSRPIHLHRGRNLVDVKLGNRAVVFRTIRDARGISRSELARTTGLNPATVTHIVRELLAQGIIAEMGVAKSAKGRRMTMLRICPESGYIIALSLSRQAVQAALTDLDRQQILRRAQEPIAAALSLSQLSDLVVALIESLIRNCDVPREKIIGVGLSAPGVFDQTGAMLVPPPNFPLRLDAAFRGGIERRTGIAVFIDNDANAMALAEMWFGAARVFANFACILADTDIGGGLVINGDLYRGTQNAAGEIGHTTVCLDGPPCACGNVGCLELYASPQAAVRQVRESVAAGRKSSVTAGEGGTLTFDMVAEAALQGDAVATAAVEAVGRALGVGAVNLINTYDPEALVITGRICLGGEIVLRAVQEVVRQRTLVHRHRVVPVMLGELRADALLAGAYCLVLREIFARPEVSFSGEGLKLPLHSV